MLWKADGIFKDKHFKEKFPEITENYQEIIDNFLDSANGNIQIEDVTIKQIIEKISTQKFLNEIFAKESKPKQIEYKAHVENYLKSFQPELKDNDDIFAFSFWEDKESEFKEKYKSFGYLCRILAVAECYNFDKRADTLKWRHPLSVQIDINTGVANGLFVVRSADECKKLLEKILLNDLEFDIEHIKMFGIDEAKFIKICSLLPIMNNYFKYDHELRAVYQTRDVTKETLLTQFEKINIPALEEEIKSTANDLKIIIEGIITEGATILKEKYHNLPIA